MIVVDKCSDDLEPFTSAIIQNSNPPKQIKCFPIHKPIKRFTPYPPNSNQSTVSTGERVAQGCLKD